MGDLFEEIYSWNTMSCYPCSYLHSYVVVSILVIVIVYLAILCLPTFFQS